MYGYGRSQNGLPITLLDIPALRHLHLNYFNIDIPTWLANLTSLESLELEETGSVREILPHLWKLTNLRKLKLAYVDDLVELPASLAKLEHLEELNIDGSDFENFPAIVGSLASLQSFSWKYCYCALPEIFDTLAALPRLKKLRLMHSNHGEGGDFLPESFCRLQAIEELHFNQWTDLQELPECIGGMSSLRVVNLSNDDYSVCYDTAMIKELPDSLGNLYNLEELDVYGLENLKQLPKSFERLSKLKRLDTMYSGIDELRLISEQWKKLEGLRIHGTLPDLRQCVNLKDFAWLTKDVFVDRYRADELIGSLSQLESLSIFEGRLDSAAFLASLTNLCRLRLSCDFESFPEGFEKLNRLEELEIWNSKSLTALPEYIGRMPSLKRLYLSGCGVKHLPKSVLERKDLCVTHDKI